MDKISSGDTAFILVAAALVMFMTPGLALFYGGMVRKKNILSTLIHSFFALGLISVIWSLVGYSLAFGPTVGGFIGSLKWLGLKGVSVLPNPDYAATIPQLAFFIYQGMFAVITPALITGAFAERIKFNAYVIFIALWSIFVYAPVAHWVWGVGGWIRQLGALDFAGGTVVHISSGAAALAAALVVGRRKGFGEEPFIPHNVPMTLLGAGILWFGWFGFNAGSALASGALASIAFVTTHLAAATSMLGWLTLEKISNEKPTALGAASGLVAGLVAITPAAGFVTPMAALVIGFAAGAVCYLAIKLKWKLKYDDALDVVGVHLVGGSLGALATGIFATKAINSLGANGLLAGSPDLLLKQFIAVAVTIAYSFVVSFLLLQMVVKTVGLRVTDKEETLGLDITQHEEIGYNDF
jgi:Amt family ammonium transporter